MRASAELLAYCGLYCGDCLGYTGVIADAAANLMQVLEHYEFERTAACVFPQQLRDYDKLGAILGFMAGLRCAGVCRRPANEDSSASCEVKLYCQKKGFHACHECRAFET
jgi:hypothetical protein